MAAQKVSAARLVVVLSCGSLFPLRSPGGSTHTAAQFGSSVDVWRFKNICASKKYFLFNTHLDTLLQQRDIRLEGPELRLERGEAALGLVDPRLVVLVLVPATLRQNFR